MSELLTIFALAAVAWLLWTAWRSQNLRRSDLDWLPTELYDAKLVWSERAFRCDVPVGMAVRIDRAYRALEGELVLVEFKRRAECRVHTSDVVELSVQRYVLLKAGHVVNRIAYVVVVLPDGRRCRALQVELEEAQQVQDRGARLVALREGRVSPSGPPHPAICSGCGHQDVCPCAPRRRS
jgi:CRISPR/Cas system-associated exonuclease Cas4 (RecB family)